MTSMMTMSSTMPAMTVFRGDVKMAPIVGFPLICLKGLANPEQVILISGDLSFNAAHAHLQHLSRTGSLAPLRARRGAPRGPRPLSWRAVRSRATAARSPGLAALRSRASPHTHYRTRANDGAYPAAGTLARWSWCLAQAARLLVGGEVRPLLTMSQRTEKSWVVFDSIENAEHDRCVDLFRRPDGSFGFEEFRRDVEDAGAWTPVAYYSWAAYDSTEVTLAAALVAVAWLGEAMKGRGRGTR